MPEQGVDWIAGSDLLTDDEFCDLIRIAVTRLGITDVRFTGGEPLLRPGLATIIERTAALEPRPRISLTTNALTLAGQAQQLREAGLNRINISLDTLDPDTFTKLARRTRLQDVLDGIDAALDADLSPVKINSVLMRGVNDHEASKLLQFALDKGLRLRFIEQMPLDPMGIWRRDQMVTAEEILKSLSHHWDLSVVDRGDSSEPADEWLINGGPESVGIIASVTRPFCASCDRSRLTADGQIRSCLFGSDDADLRGALRSEAGDDTIVDMWVAAMRRKPAGHGINSSTFTPPQRPMSAIGG
jgi:cyclic pyranopterin phosphate synthase